MSHLFDSAEPASGVAQRHHLRRPLSRREMRNCGRVLRRTIGLDRDERDNGVTHKIDPNADHEWYFVGRSLDETGLLAKLPDITPSQASKEARTAMGTAFHSDGRVLVVHLVPESALSKK